jgi:hypothetical protein
VAKLDLKVLEAHRLVEAKKIELDAQRAKVENLAGRCDEAFTVLWQQKLDAVEKGLMPFKEAFEQLQNVALDSEVDPETAPELDQSSVAPVSIMDISLAADAVGGAAVAGAAAAGAYSGTMLGVMTFASASTGTAISSLSGAAATNAALAWLGGGSLAAGGGGVALGGMVLTGVAALPAFAVGGLAIHYTGKRAMGKAESFSAEVDEAVAKSVAGCALLRTGRSLAYDLRRLIRTLTERLGHEASWLGKLVSQQNDWVKLSTDDQERVRFAAQIAVAVAQLVQTPVLDQQGVVTDAIRNALDHGQTFVV